MRTRLGIDEAGRGCVLGPMVFGAFLVEAAREEELRRLGARDSKRLSPARREALRAPLEAASLGWGVHEIPATVLDGASLGVLGKEAIVALVERFRPTVVVLDAPVPPRGIPRFVADLQARFEGRGIDVEIVAENHADDTHPCCSAASIFAKTTRDARLMALQEQVGVPLGSGYPSDPKTQRWLADVHAAGHGFPPFVRTKWATVRRLVGGGGQGRLF